METRVATKSLVFEVIFISVLFLKSSYHAFNTFVFTILEGTCIMSLLNSVTASDKLMVKFAKPISFIQIMNSMFLITFSNF